MDSGKNVNPQWSPDGKSIAFVSDRDRRQQHLPVRLRRPADLPAHRLLHRRAGHHAAVAGALAGRAEADRLAFVYYEKGDYDVYAVDNPRAFKRDPWKPPTQRPRRGQPSRLSR